MSSAVLGEPALEAEAGGSLRAQARAEKATELILASSGGVRERGRGEPHGSTLLGEGKHSGCRGGLALHKPLASCSSWGWVGQLRRLG